VAGGSGGQMDHHSARRALASPPSRMAHASLPAVAEPLSRSAAAASAVQLVMRDRFNHTWYSLLRTLG